MLEIIGLDPRQIAQTALLNQISVYELTPLTSSLEDAYFNLTRNAVEYHSRELNISVPSAADVKAF